jgi:hypothetical protein
MAQQIEIHIDKIIFDGANHHLDHGNLKAAISAQLHKLILEQGIPKTLNQKTYHHKLNGGQITWSTNQKTTVIGKTVANGIYRGLQNKTAKYKK